MNLEANIERAAEAILSADALLIGAGAGMGVDSGLPDFRGPEGFWKAYPAFRGRQFHEVSNPVWFQRDPEQAWGFFGHRLRLYRDADPHSGYAILRGWVESAPRGGFVFTSNVDGHFARAGFDNDGIYEVHGSLSHSASTSARTESGRPTTFESTSIRRPFERGPNFQGVPRATDWHAPTC